MGSFLIHVTYQLIVSLALMGFAWQVADGDIRTVIITAIITHWLKESVEMGRTAAKDLSSARAAQSPGGQIPISEVESIQVETVPASVPPKKRN